MTQDYEQMYKKEIIKIESWNNMEKQNNIKKQQNNIRN